MLPPLLAMFLPFFIALFLSFFLFRFGEVYLSRRTGTEFFHSQLRNHKNPLFAPTTRTLSLSISLSHTIYSPFFLLRTSNFITHASERRDTYCASAPLKHSHIQRGEREFWIRVSLLLDFSVVCFSSSAFLLSCVAWFVRSSSVHTIREM